eukprot:PhM_4_TR11691/c0_g1_i1/m.23732
MNPLSYEERTSLFTATRKLKKHLEAGTFVSREILKQNAISSDILRLYIRWWALRPSRCPSCQQQKLWLQGTDDVEYSCPLCFHDILATASYSIIESDGDLTQTNNRTGILQRQLQAHDYFETSQSHSTDLTFQFEDLASRLVGAEIPWEAYPDVLRWYCMLTSVCNAPVDLHHPLPWCIFYLVLYASPETRHVLSPRQLRVHCPQLTWSYVTSTAAEIGFPTPNCDEQCVLSVARELGVLVENSLKGCGGVFTSRTPELKRLVVNLLARSQLSADYRTQILRHNLDVNPQEEAGVVVLALLARFRVVHLCWVEKEVEDALRALGRWITASYPETSETTRHMTIFLPCEPYMNYCIDIIARFLGISPKRLVGLYLFSGLVPSTHLEGLREGYRALVVADLVSGEAHAFNNSLCNEVDNIGNNRVIKQTVDLLTSVERSADSTAFLRLFAQNSNSAHERSTTLEQLLRQTNCSDGDSERQTQVDEIVHANTKLFQMLQTHEAKAHRSVTSFLELSGAAGTIVRFVWSVEREEYVSVVDGSSSSFLISYNDEMKQWRVLRARTWEEVSVMDRPKNKNWTFVMMYEVIATSLGRYNTKTTCPASVSSWDRDQLSVSIVVPAQGFIVLPTSTFSTITDTITAFDLFTLRKRLSTVLSNELGSAELFVEFKRRAERAYLQRVLDGSSSSSLLSMRVDRDQLPINETTLISSWWGDVMTHASDALIDTRRSRAVTLPSQVVPADDPSSAPTTKKTAGRKSKQASKKEAISSVVGLTDEEAIARVAEAQSMPSFVFETMPQDLLREYVAAVQRVVMKNQDQMDEDIMQSVSTLMSHGKDPSEIAAALEKILPRIATR